MAKVTSRNFESLPAPAYTARAKPFRLKDRGNMCGWVRTITALDNHMIEVEFEDRFHGTMLCTATKAIGDELQPHISKLIKVKGEGMWIEDGTGVWHPETFEIKSFHLTSNKSVTELFAHLASLNLKCPSSDEIIRDRYEGLDGGNRQSL